MRDCGDCQAWCQGWLNGDAFGCAFGGGKPCVFLIGGCSVYGFRPEVCQSFYCGWSQGLLPEWMRPDLCKVLVSVERWSKGQYLRCIGMGKDISEESKREIEKFCDLNIASAVFEANGRLDIKGTDDFTTEFLAKIGRGRCRSPSSTDQAPSLGERLSLPLYRE